MYKGLVCVLFCIAAVQALPLEDNQNIASVAALPILNAQDIASVQAAPIEVAQHQPSVQAYEIEDANFTETLRIGFPTGRVINGHEAVPHSAPYIVSLGAASKTHSHACGGTIISKEWVITAAHCILKDGIGMSIVAGLHARNNITDDCQRRTVNFAKVHNGFTGGVGPNDIALLHISEPFLLNENVQPAVLPSWEEQHSGEAHIYGWGQPTWYNLFGSNVLQTVTTDVLEWDECNSAIGESPLVKSNICTSSKGEGISSCNGDSGGPLVIEGEKQAAELIGIVSWGFIPCGVSNMPSVFTRVSAFLDWINYIISSYEALQPHFL